MRRYGTTTLAVVMGALATLGGCGGQSTGEEGPGHVLQERLVLITLDTLRNDHFFGAPGVEVAMPLTRKWAEGGLVFKRHYSASSSTQPTHATLFTGLQPWEHGVDHNGAILPEALETLAERLRTAGFRTGAAVASYPLHRSFGYEQGFDVFVDSFNRGNGWTRWIGKEVKASGGFYASGDHVLDEALEMLATLGGSRQFLWFHFFDPHWPYGDREQRLDGQPTAEALERMAREPQQRDALLEEIRGGYAADVRALDRDLGTLLDALAQGGVPTHVVIVADHGESLGESQSLGHGMRLTPEQILCPLIIRSPRVSPGATSSPVGSLDVAATLLSLAGIADPAAAGRDLTQLGNQPPGMVSGMRSTFKNARELRTDGTTHDIDSLVNHYYVVLGDDVYTGNTTVLTRDDAEVPVNEGAGVVRAKELFASFDRSFAATREKGLTEEGDLQALKAMGYGGND